MAPARASVPMEGQCEDEQGRRHHCCGSRQRLVAFTEVGAWLAENNGAVPDDNSTVSKKFFMRLQSYEGKCICEQHGATVQHWLILARMTRAVRLHNKVK